MEKDIAKDSQGTQAPLITVGLMTYNRAHYLRGVIECWLNQTHKNIELVISDDASKDETQQICEEYVKKDPRVRYFRQEKNLNAPGCYKFALQQARGEYFIWASDDDLWDKRFLEDCLSVFKKRPELILVAADMVDIDKNGKEFKHIDPAGYIPTAEGTYERLKQHMLFFMNDGKLQLIFGLWKRERIMDDPLFGPHESDDHYPYYWGCDNYVVFRNLIKGPVGFFPEKRFFRRSRVLDEWRPPRPLLPRLIVSFKHRAEKIYATPYFWYIALLIVNAKQLSLWERIKLLMWNLFVMVRVFVWRVI